MTVSDKAKALLRGEEPFFIRVEGDKKLASQKVLNHEDLDDAEQRLFSLLRQWRRECATENAIAAYNVFPDATLIQIAKRKPEKPADLVGISGIGEKRIERYGEAVCHIISRWRENEQSLTFSAMY